MNSAPDRSESSLSVLRLAERLASGEALVVLDVRQPDERSFCAISVPPPSLDVHLPLSEVSSRLDALRALAARGPLVVYCHHGVRSRMVVDWLTLQGVSGSLNLDGGIHAWSIAVDPRVPRY